MPRLHSKHEETWAGWWALTAWHLANLARYGLAAAGLALALYGAFWAGEVSGAAAEHARWLLQGCLTP